MANIKKFIEKEVEKGAKYIAENGELLTEEKAVDIAGKEYLKKLGKELPIDYGFKKFKTEFLAKLTPVSCVITAIGITPANGEVAESEEVAEVDEKTE